MKLEEVRTIAQSHRIKPGRELLTMADWTLSVDISETATAYAIKGEIPGVNKEDVEINIEEGTYHDTRRA